MAIVRQQSDDHRTLTWVAPCASLHLPQVRFSKHVLPGETLRVVMWREGAADARGLTKIIFETFAVERGAKVISNAAVELSECGWGQEAGSKGKVGGAPQSKL